MVNYHCNVVSINQCGILIKGKPGTGKSSLSLGLIERGMARGWHSVLINDDQAHIENHNGSLIAKVPEPIAGKIEVYGYGIIHQDYQSQSQIDLVAEMIDRDLIERMPDAQEYCVLQNVSIPRLEIPSQHEEMAARIIFAWITDNFDRG